ncbi:hypothetical protein [Maribacter sp. 1_MG-2023]|uniref:hypothetical protein n=1 Tax=Maribacter sp. 1_MG-2023 TaxID=3062677 RepID=UPI0026E12BE3|nr:hypothetical protein [Maribacter sp. 1_MG-2023]MDO6472629.1 hypothetical protein [Maribacter sp. 1_MG-2023]
MAINLQGQVFADMELKKGHLNDSINTEYPYLLPIFGQKVKDLGFKLPLPSGMSINYVYQKADINIRNLNVGFNGGELFYLDDIVRFNSAVAQSNIVNIRPDIWVFPFLNVYGIFASSSTSTAVDVSVYVPNQETSKEVLNLSTKAEFEGFSAGFGITPTIGIGGGWLALDMNFTWTDLEGIEDPAFALVFDPRIGKTFKFSETSNLSIWTGGFRVKLNTDTKGNLPINSLINLDGINTKLDNAATGISDTRTELDTWYDSLTPLEQAQNLIKYQGASAVLNKADNFVDNLSNAVSTVENSTVQYNIEKSQKKAWNFVLGSQYQITDSFMLRAEVGFLGTRTHVITGLQYRFGF